MSATLPSRRIFFRRSLTYRVASSPAYRFPKAPTLTSRSSSSPAFTIVELLIVVVIIAILAAITVVAYNGIQARARASAASSALTQAKKKLELYKVDSPSNTYPTTGNLAAAGITDSDTTYQYTSDGTAYCVTATNATVSYYLNSTTQANPTAGGCAGHGVGGVGAVTNYAPNPSFETDVNGVSGYYSSPITRDNSRSIVGSYSAFTTTNSITNSQGFIVMADALSSAGQNYACSVSVAGTAGVQAIISGRPATSGDGYLTEGQGAQTVTLTDAWQRVNIVFTTPANTGILRIQMRLAAPASGISMWIDALMCTRGSAQYTYADGSSTNWIWNGTANASTSTGPAP